MTLRNIQPQTKLPFHGVQLPSIEITEAQRVTAGAKSGCSNFDFLKQLCRNGFKARYTKLPPDKRKVYGERVTFELDTIEALGFTNYILMVWDICRHADEVGIPRGPGRGSVSSSLACHLVGITELDPIENGLFFTRFLSKARAKSTVVDGITYMDGGLVPDIDMDFDYYRREEIFAYLNTRYAGQTSHTLTTTTMTSKALIMDAVKIYEGGSPEEAQIASDLIDKETGTPEELEDALSEDPDKRNARFSEWAENHKETCEIAMGMANLNRGEGKHASALLIAAMKIRDLMPTQSATDDEGNRHVVSGYDMYSAQEVCLKFDILGLKTLSVIKDVCGLLKIAPQDIDVNHPSIYAYLQDFKNRYGIFQLETFAQGNAAAKVKPRDFSQLAAVLAIARPGAFAYLDQFVKYVNEGVFNSIHPLIDDILKPTGGVCVYQEQFLAMLVRVGLTPDEAEGIRKIVGKKLKEKVPEAKAKIAEVCTRNGHPIEIVDLLLKIAEDSGGYQFAAAHAAAYALICARILYLKINHPIEFWWATLQMNRHETNKYEKMMVIEREMRATGCELLPPDLSKSEMGFKIEGPKSIRFALGMIRGVAGKTEGKMREFQAETIQTRFKTFQAMRNAGLSIGVASALIQAGCLGAIGGDISRSRLALEAQTFNLLTDKEKALCITLADKPEINHDVLKAIVYLRDNKDEKGKPLFSRATRFGTIKKKYEKYKEIWEMNRRNERLANYFYEKTILGYSYSSDLRSIFGEEIDGLVSVAEIEGMKQDDKVRLIGFVKEPVKSKTKAGNDGFRFILTDETGEITVRFFNKTIDQVFVANGRLPIEGDIVVLKGSRKDSSCIFANEIGIQTCKIYLKLSELKEAGEKAETGLATSPTETTSAPAA